MEPIGLEIQTLFPDLPPISDAEFEMQTNVFFQKMEEHMQEPESGIHSRTGAVQEIKVASEDRIKWQPETEIKVTDELRMEKKIEMSRKIENAKDEEFAQQFFDSL